MPGDAPMSSEAGVTSMHDLAPRATELSSRAQTVIAAADRMLDGDGDLERVHGPVLSQIRQAAREMRAEALEAAEQLRALHRELEVSTAPQAPAPPSPLRARSTSDRRHDLRFQGIVAELLRQGRAVPSRRSPFVF